MLHVDGGFKFGGGVVYWNEPGEDTCADSAEVCFFSDYEADGVVCVPCKDIPRLVEWLQNLHDKTKIGEKDASAS